METLLYHIRFLIDNIYIKVGNKVLKQSIVLSSDPRADETGGGEGESCAVCRHIGWRTHHHSSASATPGSSSPCLLKEAVLSRERLEDVVHQCIQILLCAL